MKRKSNSVGYRKRVARNHADHHPLTTQLRQIDGLVGHRHFAAALAQIDQSVAATSDAAEKSRLLSLAADCLHKQGKFSEAAVTYAQVSVLVATDPLAWLRPVIGLVRSLVHDCQTAEAQTQALAAVQQAVTFEQDYQTTLAQAQATVAAGGQAVIPPAPVRSSVVATRLGQIFFSAGEIAPAKALFQTALAGNPNGACKARLGLAEIALRENNPAEAGRLAREAIVVGQYRAKTLPAWKTLLAAGRRTGTDLLDQTLINSLAQARPSVRAKAVLMLTRHLRGQCDARWKTIADNWLTPANASAQPILAAEVRKIKLAAARLFNAPVAERQLAAQKLLQTAKIGASEWLSGTRETVRTALQQNQAPNLDAKITQGTNKFGAANTGRITHGLAHACRQAGRADLAQTLFQRNVNTLPVGNDWSRSLWALAELQEQQGNLAGSVANYWSFSQSTVVPQQLRLIALIRWTRGVIASNQPELVAQARPQIEAALPLITDYEVVLDIAAQVLVSTLGKDFADAIFQRGQQMALDAFNACDHPSPAATILFKFCRRANDFDAYAAMIATWTQLNESKRLWLWSENSSYWSWVDFVFRAYRRSNRHSEAEAFITPFLTDIATPPHGYVILGLDYAVLKCKQHDFPAMFQIYEKIVQIAPMDESAILAYYWLALRAWKQGDVAQTTSFADKLLLALGKDCKMPWKQRLQASAIWLKAGLDISRVPSQTTLSAEIISEQFRIIQNDLTSLNT